MKKLMMILAAITVLFTTAAFADDLSAMTVEELLALHQDVLDEMVRRGLPAEPESENEPEAVAERVISFFEAWYGNDPDEMLMLCDSGWKAAVEDPHAELLRILADRTPLDVTIETVSEIAGESPDGLTWCLVKAITHLDRNDGTICEKYRISLLVRKEEDGLWHINPSGLENCELMEEGFPAEYVDYDEIAVTDTTVLYYQPDGGEYYHLDQNCKRVNPKYLPLQGSFLYSELNDEPYRDLKPCEICGAPAAPEKSGSPET